MAFQNFFSEIMKYAKPDFRPIKPQGNQGDWKNDGHEPNEGKYYQVYSPENFDESAAIKKLQEDFSGLIAIWGDKAIYPQGVNAFYFVINDAYRVTPGGYASTNAALEVLRQKHTLAECRPFLMGELEDMLLSLNEDRIMVVVGMPPNPANINTLPLDIVNEVIRHIVENVQPRALAQTLTPPDFNQKIEFNGLTHTGGLLRDASYRCGTLEEYFQANSNFTRQFVCSRLKTIYDDGLSSSLSGDKLLWHILEKITPNYNKTDGRALAELQNAALVVMAYFFESCDIFKEPMPC